MHALLSSLKTYFNGMEIAMTQISQEIEDKEQLIEEILQDPDFKEKKYLTIMQLAVIVAKHTTLSKEDAVWFVKTLNRLIGYGLLHEKHFKFPDNFAIFTRVRPAQKYRNNEHLLNANRTEEELRKRYPDIYDGSVEPPFIIKPARYTISSRCFRKLKNLLKQKPIPKNVKTQPTD